MSEKWHKSGTNVNAKYVNKQSTEYQDKSHQDTSESVRTDNLLTLTHTKKSLVLVDVLKIDADYIGSSFHW